MKTEEEIKSTVEEFMTSMLNRVGWEPFYMDDEVVNHAKNMCYSILCTKYKVGYPGGSFVQAVVDNNLMAAFGSADHINKHLMWMYAELLYHH